MKYNEDRTIRYRSGLRKRLYNRLMSNLKLKGYDLESVKTKHKGTIRFIAKRDGIIKNIIGIIRGDSSYSNIAININDFRDITFDDSTFIVLLDRSHLYPMKYNTTKNLQFSTVFFRDIVLIPEYCLTIKL